MRRTIKAGILIAIILVVSGCSGTSAAESVQMPAPAVEVARVQQKDVPIQREWIGTLEDRKSTRLNSSH